MMIFTWEQGAVVIKLTVLEPPPKTERPNKD